MMTTKTQTATHTPGPWTIDVFDDVTQIESQYFTVATNVANVDAPLIAAAPELLESLRELNSAVRIAAFVFDGISENQCTEPQWNRVRMACVEALKAIAKATGQA